MRDKAIKNWTALLNLKNITDLLTTMEESWPMLFFHSANVANLSLRICNLLQLDEADRENLITGAFLHDVGKMLIDRRIIEKPGPLTEDEWLKLKKHPWRGALLTAEKGGESDVVEMIRFHHEKWDGRGYEGLRAEKIPWGARVIALADALDAMTSSRPYRLPLKMHEALEEVYQGAGSQFDPKLVAALAEKSFWQIATYRDPIKLKRLIDKEKEWLAQLTESYIALTHPLVYAQSQWLDRLVVISYQLKGYAGAKN